MIDILFRKNKIRLDRKYIIFLYYGHGLFIHTYKSLLLELYNRIKEIKIYWGGTEICN
jgi:hypothetical protein